MLNRLRAFFLASLALVSSAALGQRNLLIPAEPMAARDCVGLSKWVGGFVYTSGGGIVLTDAMFDRLKQDKTLKKSFSREILAHYCYSCFSPWDPLSQCTGSYDAENFDPDPKYWSYDRMMGIRYINGVRIPKLSSLESTSRIKRFYSESDLGGHSAVDRGLVHKPFSGDGSP